MSTKSKLNPLTLIIISAVVLFVIAAIWKSTHSDNSEEVFVTQIEEPKKVTKNKSKSLEDNFDINQTETDQPDLTVARKKAENFMGLSIKYTTPEQILEVIINLQENGMTEEADEYIEYLIGRFPDFEMSN